MKNIVLSSLIAATALTPALNAAPATLLEIAGAAWPAARLSSSVLIIVDAQREYAEGKLPLACIDDAVSNIATLLTRARTAGTPIIHVVQLNPKNRPIFAEDSPMAEIFPALAPRAGEVVIPKQLPNSFAGTSLDATLQKLGRKDLIIVGFMTHMCVSATVRSALDHGYRSTAVASCCATRDLPDGLGGIVAASDVHRMELAALRDRFAAIARSPDEIGD